LLWTGAGGTAIGVLAEARLTKSGYVFGSTVGLLGPGRFTPLHVSISDGYGVDDSGTGSLAF
jgi:hypothetical protein